MKFDINTDLLSLDPEELKRRLFTKVSLLEIFSLLLLFSLILVFSYHHSKGFYLPWDFEKSYLLAGRGDFSNFFYGYWFVPIFWLLEKIPQSLSFILWASANVFFTFVSARIFGGKSSVALMSYQMIYVIFYGQITGILLGSLALAWWGLANKKNHLAGLGFLISAAKPQLGILSIILWGFSDSPWKEKIKVLFVPIFGVILTTIAYPRWISNIFSSINNGKVDLTGNISLWQHLGPWSLLFLVPPLLLKMPKENKILFLITGSLISVPYMQQTALLALYVFPFGWLSVLGNLGFLFPFLSWEVIRFLFIVPLTIYLLMLFKEILSFLKKS
jgi:hypothetical protein